MFKITSHGRDLLEGKAFHSRRSAWRAAIKECGPTGWEIAEHDGGELMHAAFSAADMKIAELLGAQGRDGGDRLLREYVTSLVRKTRDEGRLQQAKAMILEARPTGRSDLEYTRSMMVGLIDRAMRGKKAPVLEGRMKEFSLKLLDVQAQEKPHLKRVEVKRHTAKITFFFRLSDGDELPLVVTGDTKKISDLAYSLMQRLENGKFKGDALDEIAHVKDRSVSRPFITTITNAMGI